jgi:hypothetical protein
MIFAEARTRRVLWPRRMQIKTSVETDQKASAQPVLQVTCNVPQVPPWMLDLSDATRSMPYGINRSLAVVEHSVGPYCHGCYVEGP